MTRATQCPNCEAYLGLGHETEPCWRCSVDLEPVHGGIDGCGGSVNLGSGLCRACENQPKVIELVAKRTTTA